MAATRIPGARAVFVGRDKELLRLEQALEDIAVAVLYGTAGVGKSALAAAVAERWGAPVARYTAADEPLAVLLDDVRRQLARGPVAEAASDIERVRDVAARLDELGGMLIVDDLHRLPVVVRAALLGELGNQLSVGRLVATSRERMPLRTRDAERFEMRLGELDVAGSHALWSALDRLHGAVPGFTQARLRTRGNPLFLRRAHAGDLGDDDPLSRAVRDLHADERLLAGALALTTQALPAATLVQLSPDGTGALRRLVTCMIIDLDGAGAALLHDLFREVILSSLSRDERASLHGALARVLITAQLEPVSTAREVCRHLAAGENWPELGAYLLRQAPELIRRGAVGELVRGLDQIPRTHRTAIVELARARALARLLQLHTAHDELRRLLEAELEPRFEIQLAFTQVALLTADLATAERVAREVLAVPQLPGPVLMRAQFVFAAVRAHRGAGDEAREFLASALARIDERFHQGYLTLCVALTYWLDGLDAECEAPMRRAQSLLADIPATFRTAILAPSFFTAVLARLGRFEEAAEVVARTESIAREGQDLRMRAEISSMRAMLLYERGEHAAALRLLEPVADAYERGGYTLGTLWARAWIGRILLQLGRRRRGLVLLDRTHRQAEELGVASVLRVIAVARAEDPLVLLEHAATATMPSIAALLAAARGETLHARSLLASGSAHPLSRVLARLCDATLARVEGDHADAGAHVERALVAAAEADIDADFVPSVVATIGTLRVVTPSGCRLAPAHALHLPANVAMLDGRTHELHARGKVVSFRRRVAARRLLYAVASRPGATVINEQLARRCWDAEYNPLVHDNVIRVGVRRLRLLLAGTGIDVEHDGEGYRLCAPHGWCYVEPA